MKIVAASTSTRTFRKPLVPLAERAALAARERRISLRQASECVFLTRFELSGNRFMINRSEGYHNPLLTAQAISHLGSIFHGFSLGFYFSQNDEIVHLTLKAKAFQYDHSPSLYFPFSSGLNLFQLSINIVGEYMGLDDLASKVIGKGGEALLALYNLAGETGVQKISYLVSRHNPRAKLFYSNLGFGAPVEPDSALWEVTVDRTAALRSQTSPINA
ncbi:hypothetical protein A3K48_01790 [candidate division WOR-1 bacterium RIFOXYA12_FULL_52_29]|uniref:Uncharacterized protein n=1 Tax=candidate division WOR-1 bacterium RIFOXYC12_FULL_54_18 TaxID=1802584 RepID=A0A1F4T4J7_UNCSA|nr:MAG: hypothetical protein A3K44_01790 [candidate division WOR-1 bacterium RIFOXYA2_FULL_51_19]OGC17314.1 MAG: hypothetical protein A3K48_01790 [candidate division WOR-1 bacterium RIFOXYA12_FULL_52_29]OGC26174.1 MAG: hypothetical protein A3K32_01785 [candidate division WOR-1 bacterium RIFOXYB2_FULL_45_9]OGC27731.1 MAG: hypothetical protein A3K49_01790 [candidate division WOR-1 bacterium RIFOXYC12_FULL_54_18]OGC29978.1 MAG: hypothetical protein A2346_04545 [candidate division WOR-1 bacterium R